jgi:hypothetical protein
VQQRSLREQLERHRFLLERLNTASARLIQSLDRGDVFDAVAEIIANPIGSEQVTIFNYYLLEARCREVEPEKSHYKSIQDY